MFFVFWMIVGGFWLLEIDTRGGFGSITVLIVATVTAFLLGYVPARRSIGGALVGASLLLFAASYLLRRGPGEVCGETWNGHHDCHYVRSPAPFTFAGILLLTGGIALQRYLLRRARERREARGAQ